MGLPKRKLHLAHEPKTEEQQLKLFSSAVEASLDGIHITDVEGKIIYCNPAVAKLYGYKRLELIGQNSNILNAERDFLNEMTIPDLYKKKGWSGEILQKKKDGSKFYCWLTTNIIKDSHREQIGTINIVRDITDLKKVEESFNDIALGVSSETGLVFFTNLVQYLAKVLDTEYAFVGELIENKEEKVNTIAVSCQGKPAKNFQYLLRHTPCENVMGKKVCVYPRKVQEKFPKDSLLKDMGIESYMGIPLINSKGTAFGLIVVIDKKPLNPKRKNQASAILEIFSARASAELERSRMERAFQESQRILSSLMSHLPGMAYRCKNDAECSFLFVSEGCQSLIGYTAMDLIQNKINFYDLIHPEDRTVVWNRVQEAVQERKPYQFTYRITSAEGEEKRVWEQGSGVFSSAGELLFLEGFITDITSKKQD